MMVRRIISPPAHPRIVALPRAGVAAEHVPSHDSGANAGKRLLDDMIALVDVAAGQAVHGAPVCQWEGPLVETHAADAEGMVDALMWPGDEAVERHRDLKAQLRHSELRTRRLTSPGLGDEHLEICDGHGLEPNEHGREADIMRLGEEFFGVSGEHRLPLAQVGDADGDHAGVGDAWLLRVDTLLPQPDEAFELPLVPNREREAVARFLDLGQRQRDATDVSLRCHGISGPSLREQWSLCAAPPPPQEPLPGAA